MSRLDSCLAGVKVLDLSRHLPGPLATLILADLGAEVLKVEPPAGDELRLVGAGDGGPSTYFRAINAGKRTCTIDLKTEAGRAALEAFVRESDVLVESFRPGTMTRLGVGEDRLRAINPGLIYCALSGFGQQGPFRDRAAHDLNYLALTGALSVGVPPGSEPRTISPPLADCSAGLMAVIAIIGALHGRMRDGRGCFLDMALADAPLPQLTFNLADLARRDPAQGAHARFGGDAAFYGVYRVRDGHVTLAAVEPKFWRRFCEAAGRADWIARHADPLPQTSLRAELEVLFGALTLEEACARFEAADCCFAPVHGLGEAIRSAHMAERGLVRAGPDGLLQALFPALVDGEPPRMRSPLEDLGPVGTADQKGSAGG